uniref:TnpV protein n=1 Tax=Enterocloster clostridioformis TaxID=1531 RepID=UPI001C3D33DE|nr:TnpV protein [Enterocloster clostridioformis]
MNKLTYTMQNGYRLPNLLPPQEPEMHLGKYALMRRTYLKQHRRVTYTNLLTSGKLSQHLMEIEQTALSRMEQITAQMAKAEGVTEELKASDPMKWTGLMNNIRHSAEETVLNGLIYN